MSVSPQVGRYSTLPGFCILASVLSLKQSIYSLYKMNNFFLNIKMLVVFYCSVFLLTSFIDILFLLTCFKRNLFLKIIYQ